MIFFRQAHGSVGLMKPSPHPAFRSEKQGTRVDGKENRMQQAFWVYTEYIRDLCRMTRGDSGGARSFSTSTDMTGRLLCGRSLV